MFGFKSKRYKKLERINEMIEAELRELQERYNAMVISDKLSRTTEKRVIPLHCSVTVDTYYGKENAITFAKKEVVKQLVYCIEKYITFEVRELDRDDSLAATKYEVIGKVEVIEKQEG